MTFFEICHTGNNKGISKSRQKQFRKRSNEKKKKKKKYKKNVVVGNPGLIFN